MMRSGLLRLRAEDQSDLDVISAAVQDAVFVVGDLSYDARARRFAALLGRFRWESAARSGPYERVRTILCADDVGQVRSRNVRLGASDAVGSVLAVRFTPGAEPPEGEVTLVLAGDGEIKLSVGCLDVTLTDVGEPWPTPRKPDHEQS